MRKINIPFCPEMQQAILEGRKICTSRNEKYGKIRDWFVFKKNKFIITNILRRKLDYVAMFLFEQEGFDSPKEFIQMWKKLHPRKGHDPNQIVWVHFFKETEG